MSEILARKRAKLNGTINTNQTHDLTTGGNYHQSPFKDLIESLENEEIFALAIDDLATRSD